MSFQVAPDGVRAAMIVRTKTGSELIVAPVSANAGIHFLAQTAAAVQVGADISHPIALSWQNPDDLLVLGLPASPGAQPSLYQVPLNGEPSSPSIFPVPRGVRWLAADVRGVAVGALGKAGGQIWLLHTWNGPPSSAINGSTPAYPG
jgi:hypothetical protein